MLFRRNPSQATLRLHSAARKPTRILVALTPLYAVVLIAATGCRKSEDTPPSTDQAGNPAPKAMTPATQAAIQRADQQGPAIHAANAAPGGN